MNVTDFILRSACEKAEQTPGEATRFVMDEKQWKAFLAALDRPVIDKPRLQRLGKALHWDSLSRIEEAADFVGGWEVLLHAIDDAAHG